MSKAGRPKDPKYSDVKKLLEKYIDETDIPIVAEFAYMNHFSRQYLYELPEISDTIKRLIDKKEAQLERKGLEGEIDRGIAIFSLKQLGWKDIQDIQANIKTPTFEIKIIEDKVETEATNNEN